MVPRVTRHRDSAAHSFATPIIASALVIEVCDGNRGVGVDSGIAANAGVDYAAGRLVRGD